MIAKLKRLEAFDPSERQISIGDLPMREQIDTEIREQLVVELYSK